MTRRAGALVVLEGIDGVGKSTLQRRLARRWRARGWPVEVRREPSDLRLGREAQRRGAVDPIAGVIYFTVDRALARAEVEDAVAQGRLVLQDRSYYSTLAYQGSALEPGERRAVVRLQRHVALEPDLVLWLDLAPAAALGRLRSRGTRRAPLERRRTLERVRAAYRRLARGRRWRRIDAARPAPELEARADRLVRRQLGRRFGQRARRKLK